MDWYFKSGTFFPSGQTLTRCKTYTTLPSNTPLYITPSNIFSRASKIAPISMLASHLQDIPLGFDTEGDTAFYDMETEQDGLTYKYSVINGKVYYDIRRFIQDLYKAKIRVGFNSYRFDNVVLYNALNGAKEQSMMSTYDLNSFKLYYIKDGLDLDLMFFSRLFSFDDMRMYEIARELNIDFDEKLNKKFDESKCLQDVQTEYQIYWKLEIPLIAKVLNRLVSMDIHILQNVFFDKFLRNVILQEYLSEGYLPVEYPRNNAVQYGLEGILKRVKIGEYKKVYYYDVQNTYPITAIQLGESIYPNEQVIPNLEKKLMMLNEEMDNGNVSRVIKKIANAVIGYMNDKTNYFNNPNLWYSVVTRFNEQICKVIPDDVIWANLDGFMLQKKTDLTMTGYNLRLKDYFKYIKIFNVNKYLAIGVEGKTILKGFKNFKPSGMKIIQNEFTDAFTKYQNTQKLFASSEWKEIKHRIMNNDNLWNITVRKTSEVCTQIDYLEYWEDCRIGFNDILLSKHDREKMYDEWQAQF